MSSSQTSSRNLRFAVITVVVLVATAMSLVLYRNALAQASRGVFLGFAQASYSHHNDATTLTILRYYQPPSTDSLNLQTKAYLEEGSYAVAVDTARTAVQLDPSRLDATLLLGASYALDSQSAEVTRLTQNQKSSQAFSALRNLASSNTAQAQQLYVLGLLRSSERVLSGLHQPSMQRSLLMAQVTMELKPGKAGALEASPYAKEAIALDPTNIAAQELFISVSRKTGDTQSVDAHQVLVNKLMAARP